MAKLVKLNLLIGVCLFLTSCAIFSTSMTPSQVDSTLPTLTKSIFMTQAQAEAVVKTNKGKFLVKGRDYIAPMGLTVKDDLRNGAIGIDEWVEIDGGNAYVLISYKWITVDHYGSTQLHIEFDTMLCE